MQTPLLVATDVDGTLLDPLERITPRTRGTVHRVIAAGIPFVLVTGRPPRWVGPVVEELGHAGLVVCANGAVLYDAAAGRVLRTATLDPLQLRDAANAVAAALPEARLAVERPAEDGDTPFLTERGYRHPWPDGEFKSAPRDEILGLPATKLLVRQPGATSDVMADAVSTVLGAAVEVTFSTGSGLIELSAPRITKGSGLAEVAKRAGVSAADVVAFGDMPNDLPMLSWAGHGVAMANAHPDVLAAADEVTAPHGEDGVALVLERWF